MDSAATPRKGVADEERAAVGMPSDRAAEGRPARAVVSLSPRQFRRICLLLAFAALGLRVVGLRDKVLIADEMATWKISRELTRKAIGIRPPLSFVVIGAAIRIRDTQTMLLLPAVVLGALTVGLIGWTGRVAFGWPVGLIAALWLLFLPVHLRDSQYARYYSFMTFFSLLSYLYLELWLRMRRWRYLSLWLLSSVLNFLSHFFSVFVIAIQSGLVLTILGSRFFEKHAKENRARNIFMLCATAIVLATGAWVGYLHSGLDDWVHQYLSERAPYMTPGIHISWAFWRPYLEMNAGWPHGAAPWLLLLFVFGMLRAWRSNKLFLFHTVPLIIGPVLALYLVQPLHFIRDQFFCFQVPFYLLGVSAGVILLRDSALHRFSRSASHYRLVWFLASATTLVAPFLAFRSYINRPVRREYPDIIRTIQRQCRPNDSIVFTDSLTEWEFRNYAKKVDLQIQRYSGWESVKGTSYANRLARPFWLISNHLHHQDHNEREWVLNAFTQKSFDNGYVSFSAKHLEMNLGGDVLNRARRVNPPDIPPSLPQECEAVQIPVYIPHSGDYYVQANQTVRQCLLRVDSLTPARWIPLTTTPRESKEKVWIPEGRQDLTLVAREGVLQELVDLRIRVLPAVGGSYTVNGSEFDIVRPVGSFDAPVTYRGHFGIESRVRCFLYYPVFVEKAGSYEFAITASNDRPTTNLLGVFVGKRALHFFYFNKRDNSLETKSTIIRLGRGFQPVGILNGWYHGIGEQFRGPIPDLNKTTFVSEISLKFVE